MTDSRLLQRQEIILRILQEEGAVLVSSLADRLDVSGWTVRRDLARMVEEGTVQRQHGTVSLVLPQPMRRLDTFESRSNENLSAKEGVGQSAARLLKPNQYVAIGAGTTTTHVARELAKLEHKPLHIMTNALNIAMELSRCPDLHVTCTGGDVRRDHYTLTGPVTERALRNHFYDVAVIGVSGIAEKEGLTVDSQLDALALEIMIEQSRQLIVVADTAKLDNVHFVRLAPLSRVDVLVIDNAVPPQFMDHLAEIGVEVVCASCA